MYDRTSRTQAFTPSSRSSDEKKSNEYFNDKEKVRLNIKRRKTRHWDVIVMILQMNY